MIEKTPVVAPAEVPAEEVEPMETKPAAEETTTLSLEMLGGKQVKPGDVVNLEVVDISPDDGTFSVRYASPKPESGGISKAAAVFDEGK